METFVYLLLIEFPFNTTSKRDQFIFQSQKNIYIHTLYLFKLLFRIL